METAGLIKDSTDLKILILYVLRHLSAPVEPEQLYEICLCDNGVEYFSYAQCLSELVDSGHIEQKDEFLFLTDKGKRNAETLESSIPFSVRTAADRTVEAASAEVSRYHLIRAEQTDSEEGSSVHLSFSDGSMDLLEMKLYVGDPGQAKRIRKNFRRRAEKIYMEMIASLSGEDRRK